MTGRRLDDIWNMFNGPFDKQQFQKPELVALWNGVRAREAWDAFSFDWLTLASQTSLDKQSSAKPMLAVHIVVETCFYLFNLDFEADKPATSMSHIWFDLNGGGRTFPNGISLYNLG